MVSKNMSTKNFIARTKPERKKKQKEFDIKKNINIAVKSGKVIIGSKRTIQEMRHKKFKMIILADNCPAHIENKINYYNSLLKDPIYIHKFYQSSWELGLACGKPFMVASLGLYDEGDSDLLRLMK
jgi:large subunit ribosomal protein L30e